MGMKFFDEAHSRQKLHNTLCMYAGEPFFVTSDDRGDGDTVSLHSLRGERVKRVRYTDDKFDYQNMELGYINYNERAHYLTREPARINQQGLTGRALLSTPPLGVMRAEDVLLTQSMYNCVMGKHPTVAEALRQLGPVTESMAISRHVALGWINKKTYCAYYRGRAVAMSTDGGKSFKPTVDRAGHLVAKRLRAVGLSVTE